MGAKYYVWGAGAWRELDVAAGRVAGWRRRARFVFVRRARLCVAPRRAVLRALRALAAAAPGAAADGPRLPLRSKLAVIPNHRCHEAPAVPPCEHHHCCAHFNGCINNNTKAVNYPLVSATPLVAPATSATSATSAQRREVGTQCEREAWGREAGGRAPAITISLAPDFSSGERCVSVPAPRSDSRGLGTLLADHKPDPTPAATPRTTPTVGSQPSDDKPRARSKQARTVVRDKSSCEEACKELVIPERDVAALRAFVARTRGSALARFDADLEYKRALFYAINPLVTLQRCAPRAAPPAPRHTQRSLEHDTDKENKEATEPPTSRDRTGRYTTARDTAPRSPRTPRPGGARLRESARDNREAAGDAGGAARGAGAGSKEPAAASHSKQPASDSKEPAAASHSKEPAAASHSKEPVGAHAISKRASASSAKEYSNLEDYAIVAWVSGGSRASLVNGNVLWRDLQEQYPRLTGHTRSWHSLRNRYLRYILPALGALHLPPSEESRLRAAAATGALKRRKRDGEAPPPARRPSIFKEPERGASSRRPRRPPSSDEDAPLIPTTTANEQENGPSSPRRSLRSNAREEAAPPRAAPPRAAPPRASTPRTAPPRPARARSPRYSEVTRRFATRRGAPPSSSSSPAPSSPSPERVAPRTRRLFNPNTRI